MQVKINNYTEFELTEAEQLQGAVFTELQIAVIRNLIASFAIERAGLTIDYSFPEAEKAYILAQQKLLGSIEALNYLLALSEDSMPKLEALVQSTGTAKD